MKKILVLTLAALLITGSAYAAGRPVPASSRVIYQTVTGTTMNLPSTVVVPVRYGRNTAARTQVGLQSGDIVLWDTTSSDGVSIIPASGDCIAGDGRFAGVLVTDVLTCDDHSSTTGNEGNWGWMCTKGLCIASVDAAITVSGLSCKLGVSATGGLTTTQDAVMSRDVGSLLETTSGARRALIMLD